MTSESKRTEEFEVYKLNFMFTIALVAEDKKKNLMTERDSILKRYKNLLDSNTKLETTISALKFDLAKANLFLQCMISDLMRYLEYQ